MKEEIQRQKLSVLYFKHLNATWEEIEIERHIIVGYDMEQSDKWRPDNKKQYLQAYK